MEASNKNRSLEFFKLPREIRDDIYSRIVLHQGDHPSIILAPRGGFAGWFGRPKETRTALYKQYQEFVSLFTVSRQFYDEALPIFWQQNTFSINRSFSLSSTFEASEDSDTTINYIGPSGKLHIANVSINVLCTVFVERSESSEQKGEHATDLGVTIKGLLDMMPNLQSLDLQIDCKVKREEFPGEVETEVVLKKAAEALLESRSGLSCFQSTDPPKLVITLFGDIKGRPIREAREQAVGV